MFGDKLFNNVGFPTPADIPEDFGCRQFSIPASTAWFAVIMGCLTLLTDENNWQQFDGGISPETAAEQAQLIIDAAYENECVGGDTIVRAPFWDTATDVDDEATPELQTWYGEVDDPEAAPASLTFAENIAIWTFTGFLAISATPGAAIVFQTLAPAFVLAMRGDDVGEVIRILVDGEDMVMVDTTGFAGELINVPLAGDSALSTHDIMLIKVS